MATKGKLNITFRDKWGKTSTVHVECTDPTIAKAKTLADWLDNHSDAEVRSYGFTQDRPKTDKTNSGKYDSCYQSLRMMFEDANGQKRTFSIPAPRDEDVNDKQQPVSDLPRDTMQLLEGLKSITKPTRYNGGGLKSRIPEKAARDTAVSGV